MRQWLFPVSIFAAGFAVTLFALTIYNFHTHLRDYAKEEDKELFARIQREGTTKTSLDIATASMFIAFVIMENYIGALATFVVTIVRKFFISSFWD